MIQRDAVETPQSAHPFAVDAPTVIIADDLTGACDSGVAYMAAGRRTRVLLDVDRLDGPEIESGTVLAISTESRELSQARAAERVARTIVRLGRGGVRCVLFKKVDSAARGHLGPETIAALDASGTALALMTPAFPQMGRTVRAGVLHIRDISGQDSTVDLRELFREVEAAQIGTLRVGSVVELEQEIAAALAHGVRVLLCDSQTQLDLEHLAIAAQRTPRQILLAGSAGLAYAHAATLSDAKPRNAAVFKVSAGRTLVICGTDHPVTSLQLAHLTERIVSEMVALHRVEWEKTSLQTMRNLFNGAPTAALVLTGGETAAYVLRALGASSIRLAGEFAPGIPWGIVEGGDADGCMVVTKSGGFGDASTLVEVFEFCSALGQEVDHASA